MKSNYEMEMIDLKKGKNCYQILGLSYDASEKEVRDAYHKICVRFQSGNQQSDEEAEYFERATQAFDVLINPDLRDQYDRSLVEDPCEFLEQVENGTLSFEMEENLHKTQEMPLVNGITEPKRRVRKGTLTGMGGKGRLARSAMPSASYTEADAAVGSYRRRKTTSGSVRRPTLDLPRGAASEFLQKDDNKVPFDYVLLFLAIGVPLLTLIWACWVVLSR